MSNCDTILSGEECQTILKKHFGSQDFELLEYKIGPLSDNIEGFLGEHFLIKAHIKQENKHSVLSFFAKIQPSQYDLQLEYSRSSRAFESEIFFYEKLLPEYKKYCDNFDESIIPKYYFSRGEDIVVLENCGEKNYVVADTPDVMCLAHIKLVLKSFAKFHSASIVYEEMKSAELGRTYRLIEDYEDFLQEPFFRGDKDFLGYRWHITSLKCIDAIIDRMQELEISKEKFKEKLHQAAQNCFEIVKPTNKFRNVCCHGDLWKKNVLFKYENGYPTECKILDFQLLKYNPPIYDVLKFIHQVTSSETRQHHLEDLLWFYYDNLRQELELSDMDIDRIIPRSQFKASYKYVLPHVKIEALYYYTFHKVGDKFMKNLMADKEAFKKYTFFDRRPFVTDLYTEGSYFKKWMDELLLETKDILVHDGFAREDCHSVLKKKLNTTNYDLIKYEIISLEEKGGFMGDHKKINVTVNYRGEKQELKFFAKFMPNTEFSHFAISSGAFNNEIFMYENVFEEMRKLGIQEIKDCVSKSFFTRTNDVVVIEDLNVYGFIPINKHKALNYDHVYVIVRALAKLHASCFLLEEMMTDRTRKPFRLIEEYKENLKEVCYVNEEGHIGKLPVQSAIRGTWTHIDLFPDKESTISDEVFKKKIEKIYSKLMYEYSEPSNKFRNVICHGDLWSSNILIKYDTETKKPIQCKFVDFQCVKKCPPAQDLMALIYLVTSRKFRANYMSEILELYHKELSNCLNKYGFNVDAIIPFKEFLESCEYYKPFAVAQTVTHFQFIMASSNDMAKLFADNDLCYKTFYVDRSEFITKLCRENQQYKIILGECIKDLRILCETIDI